MKRISILHILIAIFIVQVQKNQAQTTTNYGEGSGTQGEKNTFLGYNAGALTMSNDNSFFGYNAGAKNATGTHNMFLGRSAGFNNTTASYNMFFGSSSGLNTNTGGYNMFLGAFSGFSNKNGNSNIYIGFSSGRNNTAGRANVFIGSSSGTNNKGNSNVFLGYSAGYDELGSNKLYIENSKNEIPLIYGDFSTNQVGINVKPTSSETTFAVGGQAEILGKLDVQGSIKSNLAIFEAVDEEAAKASTDGLDWFKHSLAIAGGKVVNTLPNGFNERKLMFFDLPKTSNLPAGAELSIRNDNNKKFFNASSYDKETRVYINDPEGTEIFKAGNFAISNEFNNTNEVLNWVHLPKPNSRLAIGTWAMYKPDHQLTVRGSGWFENEIITDSKIGIGTESPDRALDIAGGDTWQVKLSNTSETKRMFMGWYESRGAMEISTWGDGTFQNVPLSFLPQKVTFNGNVGIGVNSPLPDYRLSVNGKIKAKEVLVDVTGWPDYVFKSDYELPSLKEVEKHIKNKGHLINVPSAKEAEKNGIKLGEMNAKLLEKVEELTLYTLSQEKKIEKQAEQLKKQEGRLKRLEKLLLSKLQDKE
ncbi:hypothetical protein [Tenacibaculum sp. 190524A02b]|uniref:hypothetical protein n=1 Tax=Tenacibaculum vairaonense TaxID=3137860 RepID=UPI0031FB6CC6